MQLYPAIKARMGDWNYYIVRMTMREIAREVQLASELWEDKTLSDAIQRALDESRVKQQIVNFLSRRDDRFFASLVVAAIGGNPQWTEIKTRFGAAFGELSFEINPRYYALDGQHRLRAIQELMEDLSGAPPGFADEQLSVLVVVREHQDIDDQLWLRRYRRLFSSLNRYAKPTDPDTNIIMDEDDVFAIVTRRLITDHSFFRAPGAERKSFRVLMKGKNLKAGAPHFTSLQTLYAMNKILLMTVERQQKWGRAKDMKAFLQFRPEESEIDRFYKALSNCWDALLLAVPELREAPQSMRSHDLPSPNPEGFKDHLVFWPIGQELFAGIARSLLNESGVDDQADISTMERSLRPLGKVPWDLHEVPWRYLLLVPSTPEENAWRMRSEDRAKAVAIAQRLLRWVVGLDALEDDAMLELRADWQVLLYPEPPEEARVEEMWKQLEGLRARILTSY